MGLLFSYNFVIVWHLATIPEPWLHDESTEKRLVERRNMGQGSQLARKKGENKEVERRRTERKKLELVLRALPGSAEYL